MRDFVFLTAINGKNPFLIEVKQEKANDIKFLTIRLQEKKKMLFSHQQILRNKNPYQNIFK